MTYTAFTISGNEYVSYATLAEANVVLAIDPARKTAWADLNDVQKMEHLVAATLRLDLLDWLGQRAGSGTQEHAFPRTGLVYEDGSAVPRETETGDPFVPLAVTRATILLAGSVAISPTHADAGGGGPDQRRITKVKAGSAEVEFADPVAGAGPDPAAHQSLADQTVLALVQQWLRKPATSDSGSGEPLVGSGAEYFGSPIGDPFDPDYDRSEGFS